MDRKRTKSTTRRYQKAQEAAQKFVPSQEVQVVYHPDYYFTVNRFPYDATHVLHFLVSPRRMNHNFNMKHMCITAQSLFKGARIWVNEKHDRSVPYRPHAHILWEYDYHYPGEDFEQATELLWGLGLNVHNLMGAWNRYWGDKRQV